MSSKIKLLIVTALFILGASAATIAENSDDSVIDSAYSSSGDFMYASGTGKSCAEAIANSLLKFKEKASLDAGKCQSTGGVPEMNDAHGGNDCLYVGESAEPYLHNRWGHLSCAK